MLSVDYCFARRRQGRLPRFHTGISSTLQSDLATILFFATIVYCRLLTLLRRLLSFVIIIVYTIITIRDI